MSLTLYLHPLASYCHKVLIALYENQTPFEPRIVDFSDPQQRAALEAMWPMATIPVLHDARRGRTVPETSVIIEYLHDHYPGAVALLPDDPDARLQVRLWDRFFDLYVSTPMQKCVGDRLRPSEQRDAIGVAEAHAGLRTAYGAIERQMASATWAVGEAFSLADCSAAPALFYAEKVVPFRQAYPNTAAYFNRLLQRPSFSRTLEEAAPFFHMFPLNTPE